MSTNEGYEAEPEVSALKSAKTIDVKKHPCVLCQHRKIKCDRSYPCSNCKKASAECISPATLPARKRKKRFPEAELLARIRKYEHHLKNYGADLDAINAEPNITLSLTETSASILASNLTNTPESHLGPESATALSMRRVLRQGNK